MNKFSILILAIIVACSVIEDPQDLMSEKDSNTIATNSFENAMENKDSLEIWLAQSRRERNQFIEKYSSKWSTGKLKEPKKFPWKTGHKILVYYVAGEAEKNATWECRTSGGKKITQDQYTRYCAVINHPDSYNNTVAPCFIPGLAIVVYDEENVPFEYSEVCFDCNKIVTQPYDIGFNFEETKLYGLSSKARATLREMFTEWGVPYNRYNDTWDQDGK